MEKKILKKIADKIIEIIQKQLIDNDNVASSDLKNNITSKIKKDEINIEMLDYAKYVELGTKPHMPPISAIKRWVELKNININPWAIAINIKKYGTKPHKFLYVIEDIDISDYLDEYISEYQNVILENLKKINKK